MSTTRYAAAGASNLIKNIAIVGAGGQMGTFIVNELLKNKQFKVTALSRPESKSVIPEGVEVKHIDYEEPQSIINALQGQQVLIVTMAVQAPPDQQDKLIDAASKAKVDWFVPNQWGYDVAKEDADKYLIGKQLVAAREHLEKVGQRWIAFPCGFWYEYSLSGGLDMYGIDSSKRKANLYNGGKVALSTSTWELTALAVARVFALPEYPKDTNDNSLTISKWTNDYVRVASFTLNQRQMLDEVHKVLGTTDADWDITNMDPQEAFQSGIALMQQGDRTGFARALYSRMFYEDSPANLEMRQGSANALLNLPQEDLHKCTQKAVKMTEEAYIPNRFRKMAAETEAQKA